MFSFIISLVALIIGYIIYGKFIANIFNPDPSKITPAISKADGIDYVALPSWKVFMIQFLNIAGTGPIFGAIMGAKFGPSSYLWIVFGCIFAGAVHDYFCGMLSMRHDGASLPELVGSYLGNSAKNVTLIFTVILLMLVGTVFVYSPALILGGMAEEGILSNGMFWVAIIFAYYIIATLLPIDKIIGKIYPLFAISLLFMAAALMVGLFIKWPSIPEVWDGLGNRAPSLGMTGQQIFPALFITIACGAISGFHGTQSPLMARCLKNENMGRPVFYGAMITEGLVALIWASVSSYFFFDGGYAEVGSTLSAQAPEVVTKVSQGWLGLLGGILAILGVVAAPITSGDTALRSARLIIAEAFKMPQKKTSSRLIICIPMFALTALLLWYNIEQPNGFNKIWRYFGWANQTLATFTLWTATIFLTYHKKKPYFLLTLLPACFMTSVTLTFILVDKVGFNLPQSITPYLGVGIFIISGILYFLWYSQKGKKERANQILK